MVAFADSGTVLRYYIDQTFLATFRPDLDPLQAYNDRDTDQNARYKYNNWSSFYTKSLRVWRSDTMLVASEGNGVSVQTWCLLVLDVESLWRQRSELKDPILFP